VISIPEQRLLLITRGQPEAVYPVSTSKFGVGDRPGSCATPLGKLEVAKKIGAGAPPGMKFKRIFCPRSEPQFKDTMDEILLTLDDNPVKPPRKPPESTGIAKLQIAAGASLAAPYSATAPVHKIIRVLNLISVAHDEDLNARLPVLRDTETVVPSFSMVVTNGEGLAVDLRELTPSPARFTAETT